MLTPMQRQLLYNYMDRIITAIGPIDTRKLISLTVHSLSQQIPNINRHHAAGMLNALKSMYTITIVTPDQQSFIA